MTRSDAAGNPTRQNVKFHSRRSRSNGMIELDGMQRNVDYGMRGTIRNELESTRSSFHELLDSLSEEDFHNRSNNPAWTNGEILFHMTLGFILIPMLAPMIRFFGRLPDGYSKLFARFLNFGTALFNWFNALGARIGGKVFTRQRIRNQFDRVYARILRLLDSIPENEWRLGMYYPTKWEPLFGEYMTLEDLFLYTTIHFRFHLEQISRS